MQRLLLPALLRRDIGADLLYRAMCIPRSYRGFPVPVAALARSGRQAGIVTHVWTIDSPRVAKHLWQKGVHGIVTNDPGVMLRARKEL
jgi:glycerophosphoryl diester phosphodiesterase